MAQSQDADIEIINLDDPETESSEPEMVEEEQVDEEAPTDAAEEQPETEEEPEGEAEAEEAASDEDAAAEADTEPEADASEEPPEPSQPEPEPFSFRADGKRVDVEGAVLVQHSDLEGNPTKSVVMPEQVWQRVVQPHLADRAHFEKTKREFEREIADLSPDRNEDVVRARALVDELDKVLASEEAAVAFFENFTQNAELLRLRAEKAVADANVRVRDERDTVRQERERDEEFTTTVSADIPFVSESAVKYVAHELGIEMDADLVRVVSEELQDNPDVYYLRADEQVARQYNVGVGELVRDDDRVLRTVRRFASLAKTGSKKAAEIAEAAQRNDEMLRDPKPKPRTVPAKGSPAKEPQDKPIKNRDDFMRWAGVN